LKLGRKTVDLLKEIPGAVDVAIEQEGPQPQLVIDPQRDWCARYNVRVEDVNILVNTALGGDPVGVLYEGERVFDIAVKFDRTMVESKEAIERMPVFTQDGTPIPLSQVAKVYLKEGQTLIAREGGRLRITVRCDIVGRDQGASLPRRNGALPRRWKTRMKCLPVIAWPGSACSRISRGRASISCSSDRSRLA
jgi:cobalt-zinc-cadmium resistance protein CzcA